MTKGQLIITSWISAGVYVVVTLVRGLFPDAVPAGVALTTVLPFVFALTHGSANYRFSDMLVFAVVSLVVSNLFENTSILTGFPFGHYYYTDVLGPKLFLVPLLIGPAYVGMGYLAWVLARVILGVTEPWLPGRFTVAVPVLASFIMVSWDLSFDPTSSTIEHRWIWLDGGSYFGVPYSNFMGWFLTVYVYYQLFALYLRRRRPASAQTLPESKGYWLQPVVLYGITALKFPLNIVTHTSSSTITDPAGALWRTQDIYGTSGLVSIFTMGAFTVLGLLKVAGCPQPARVRREHR
jgi:uncharacterized membrane protein